MAACLLAAGLFRLVKLPGLVPFGAVKHVNKHGNTMCREAESRRVISACGQWTMVHADCNEQRKLQGPDTSTKDCGKGPGLKT